VRAFALTSSIVASAEPDRLDSPAVLSSRSGAGLRSARRIFEDYGLGLDGDEPRRRFGRDLIEQTWSLDLAR